MAGFTSGGDIEHSSGDTFKVEIVSEVGFTEGTTMRLQVSDNEFDTAKINKSFNLTGESFVMSLTSSEEASLTIGNYIYRLTFFDTSGNIITQKSGNFIVKWGVAAGANAADISTLGEKKIIEEIGVLDGKITAEAAARQSADALKADISTTYTKTQVDTKLDGKQDKNGSSINAKLFQPLSIEQYDTTKAKITLDVDIEYDIEVGDLVNVFVQEADGTIIKARDTVIEVLIPYYIITHSYAEFQPLIPKIDFSTKTTSIFGNVIVNGGTKGSEFVTDWGNNKDYFRSLSIGNTGSVGIGSVAMGNGAIAYGLASASMGWKTEAIAERAHAEGYVTKAKGHESHAEGRRTIASGVAAHAEGEDTFAAGLYGSHAEGSNTQAIGQYGSHAEGNTTIAEGKSSHSEGDNTYAEGISSHAECSGNRAEGNFSHAEGKSTKALGESSHSEGKNVEASGEASHAEGLGSSIGSGGASGKAAHSEGWGSLASGEASHAENWSTAAGAYSHSEGYGTEVKSTDLHAHVEGLKNVSMGADSHVEGRYNLDDGTKYAHVIGGGSDNTHRKNIHTLDWNGNAVYGGKVTVGNPPVTDMDVTTKRYVDTALDGKVNTSDIDSEISPTSERPVQNKVIKTALDGKVDKETGKSLINEDVASHMEHFSSPDDEHNIYVGANLSVGGNIEIGVNKLSTNSTDNIEFYNTITETSSSLQDYLDEKQNKPKSRLIEKIIVGYTLMTVKPSDWDSNYTDYYVNTGTDIRIPVYTQNSNPGWNSASYYRYNADGYTMLEIQPSDWTTKYNTYYEKVGGTYTLVGGTTAPIWETEKYYSVNSTISRNTEPNGTPYNFQKIFYTVDGKSYAGTTKPTYFAAQFLTRTQDYLMYNSGVFGSTLGSAYGTAGCFVKLNEKTYMMLSAQQGNSGVHDATLKGGILNHSYNSAYTDAKLYDGSPIEQFHLYTAANNSGFGFTGGTEIFITAEEAEQEG